MKTTVIKTTVLSMVMFFAIAATAGNPATGIAVKADQTVEIRLDTPGAGTFTLNVYNASGARVFEKTVVTTNGVTITQDASGFPSGFYTYEVISGKQIVYSARILKSDDGSMECRPDDCSALASISRTGTDRVLVRLLRSDQCRPRITVTNASGDVLYTKRIRSGENHKITYDINAFPQGDYTFAVYTGKEMIAYRKITK